MQLIPKLIFILLLSTKLCGQDASIKTRHDVGELKMTFPGIYFKHNSTDYATMPYIVDSCFKYIALHIKDISDIVIWRDSLETEKLSQQRIKKVRIALSKYKVKGIYIESMKKEQKISRHTINAIADSTQIKYLLTLNSVFEIAKTRLRNETMVNANKKWHVPCWMNLQLNKAGRKRCKMERKINKSKTSEKKKKRKRLVWTGWKTGFHWSTAG